jgi:hypothetical protein
MTHSTQRTILRWTHILFGFPILGYIYGPPAEVQQYAPVYQFFIVPVLVLSGLWMWKGDAIRRLLSKNQPDRIFPHPDTAQHRRTQ